MRRFVALAPAASAVVLSATLLAGCSTQSGLALARQACAHVAVSIRYYQQYVKDTDPTTAAQKLQQAYNQLGEALPLAAQATSDDGSWNELMTTIQEGNRVSEGYLIPSLRASCQNAATGTPGLPLIPKNLPPEPSTPGSSTTAVRSTSTTSSSSTPRVTPSSTVNPGAGN